MSDNPTTILYDQAGNAVGVSGSMTLPTGALGQLIAGVDSSGFVRYATVTSGSLEVTGSLRTVPSGIQTVTGSLAVVNEVRVTTTGSLPVIDVAAEASLARRFDGNKITGALNVTAIGDTTVHTPASGKTITLFWVGLSASQSNAGEATVTVKLGAKVCYVWYLGNPGAFAHWEPITANNPNDALVVNLSTSASPGIAVNFTLSEA